MAEKMRHINMKIHNLRDAFELGEIETVLMRTDEMPADIFTKRLVRKRHEYLRRLTCGYGTSTDLERRDSKPGITGKLPELLARGIPDCERRGAAYKAEEIPQSTIAGAR